MEKTMTLKSDNAENIILAALGFTNDAIYSDEAGDAYDAYEETERTCPVCNGSGEHNNEDCKCVEYDGDYIIVDDADGKALLLVAGDAVEIVDGGIRKV